MDRSEIVVCFALDAEEARRATAELLKKTGVTKATLRFQGVLSILWLSMGIVEVATNHLRGFGWFYVVGGCLYGCTTLQLRSRLINVPAGVDTWARFDAAGIAVERPAVQTLPWSAVEGVDRFATALVVRFQAAAPKPPLPQRLVIPRRALADGGNGLWELSERMLLGPLRRVSAQLSVDETGALRRNDAGRIGNLRARSAPSKRIGRPQFPRPIGQGGAES